MVNIAYLLILRTRGMEKSCEQGEDMQVGLKTWQAFKDHFAHLHLATARQIVSYCKTDRKSVVQ